MDPTTTLKAVREWPLADRLEFLFRLWDQLVEDGWQPEPTDELMAELDRRLAAHLSEGCPGRALGLDLETARKQRRDAAEWLAAATTPKRNYDDLMARTEALAKGDDNLEAVVGVLYSLIEDLLHLRAGRPPLRNVELESTLRPLASRLDWAWMERAAQRLDALQRNLRRNVNRQLALEGLVAILSS